MNTYTIAIDPGVKSIAYALFFKDMLIDCGYKTTMRAIDLSDLVSEIWPDWSDDITDLSVVCEMPRMARGRPERINDQIDLACSAGIIASALVRHFENVPDIVEDTQFVYPSTWKGQRPKDVDNKYTLSLLEERELEILDNCYVKKSLKHNVIDAIGIGLWKVGRR